MLRWLLGNDADLARRLLDDATITVEDLLEILDGEPRDVLEHLAPVLLERAVTADRIARAAGRSHGWVGSESAAYQRTVDYFDDLGVRTPTLKAVAEAGRAHQVALRDAAHSRERQVRIRGR
jgi:hypothetical protein